jgi:3-deoxy-7-phosphoheptulonate synthase
VINVDGIAVGGDKVCVMAGPCSVETEEQLLSTARAVKAAGATILRGGAYKPRTSPYEFQGLGKEGLRLLDLARKETGLKIITEVLSEQHVEHVAQTADILQIGARNAQNFQLLIECARTRKPVLLKRGLSQRIDEWLLAAEYLLAHGNSNVMFCERGIRTFETYTRNTLDLSAVAIIKQESHLPVIVDPSQGCGRADLVRALCRGAVAMGVDGLLIEVHPNPAEALSDGQQQVDFNGFAQLMKEIEPLVKITGRTL